MFTSLWVLLALAYAAPSEPRIGRHAPADICFHSGAPEGWSFIRAFVSKSRKRDAGWQYRTAEDALVTFYVFPEASRGASPLQMAADAVIGAAGAVENARWGELMSVRAPGLAGQGVLLHGEQITDQPSDGAASGLQELIVAWSLTPWTLKIRASWSDSNLSPTQLLEAILPWGAMPCDDLPPGHADIVNVRREMKGPL